MAIEFPSYDRGELEQRGRDLIRTRRRGADVSDKSDFDITARLLAALAWGMQEQGKVARNLLDPRRAFGPYLAEFMAERGLGRDLTETTTTAAKSIGRVILRSTTASQTQPAGSVLRHADGTTYTLDAAVTTPATAAKVLRSGQRSGRRRLYQGHLGAGFVAAAVGEVYLSAGGELCALLDVENGVALKRWLFDLYNELDALPAMHTTFTQQLGAVGSITAQVAGQRGNKDPKDVLTLVSPAGTMLAEASILRLSGGLDAMDSASQQGALTALYGARTGVGTLEDIRRIALSYPRLELRECYVVPATSGLGTYTILPVLVEGQYVGAAQLGDLLSYVSARLSPVDKVSGALVYEVLDTSIDYLNIACAEIYAPDWTLPQQSMRGVTVTTTGSSSLALSAVSDLAVGDRIIVHAATAAGAYICQRRVSSLVGNTVGLETPLPFPPAVGAYVTPGGPLADAIIEAASSAYELRAPSVSDTGPQVRLPASIVSSDPDAIAAAVSRVPGVVDVARMPGPVPALVQAGGVLVPSFIIRMYVEV
jgi:uncharacterized phage protein gp47/JayE